MKESAYFPAQSPTGTTIPSALAVMYAVHHALMQIPAPRVTAPFYCTTAPACSPAPRRRDKKAGSVYRVGNTAIFEMMRSVLPVYLDT